MPNGSGWNKTRELVANFLNKLEGFDCAIAYIGHLSTKRVEDGMRKYDKNTISLWSSMGNDMLAWADFIFNIEAYTIGEKLSRIVYTTPTQSRESKNRALSIDDPEVRASFEKLNGWKWSEDDKENWTKFRGLFT